MYIFWYNIFFVNSLRINNSIINNIQFEYSISIYYYINKYIYFKFKTEFINMIKQLIIKVLLLFYNGNLINTKNIDK